MLQNSGPHMLQYIALYREHPEIVGRFAPEAEKHLGSLR
jgi:hypothetical protein